MTAVRRPNLPKPVAVQADAGGRPVRVGRRPVEAVRETWLLDDAWWTSQPVRRRYWEVLLLGGKLVVLFHDLEDGAWFSQRG